MKPSRRALIVEDDAKLAAIIEHKLKHDGFEVSRVATGFEAGMLIRSLRPHIVLLDLMLPGVDGAEVCRQIRGDPELAKTRVLGMSASSDEAALDRFRKLVDDFMPKPFKLAEITPRIDRLLEGLEPHPDDFERNRVVLLSPDSAWSEAARKSLSKAGYIVETCATPEAAGFAAARTQAVAVAVHAVDDGVVQTLRRAARVVDGSPEKLPEAVASAAGRIVRRRRPSVLPAIFASAGILAVAAAFLLWPRSTPTLPEPDPEVAQWAARERQAADHRLVYYLGRYVSRETLGEGTSVRLKDRTLEGFLAGSVLHTTNGPVTIRKDEILEQASARQPYEHYWERAAAVPPRNADAHHALALWCRQNGMTEAADREFRLALIVDPDHEPSRRELGYSKRDGRWTR